MTNQTNIYSGRAAEFLAAYHLEMMGLRTTHVDLPYDDLWCAHPDGHLLRVQVKSSAYPYKRKDRPSNVLRYQFKIDRKSPYAGIYIFVAVDKGLMIARQWDDTPPLTLKLKPEDFTADSMSASITKEFNL